MARDYDREQADASDPRADGAPASRAPNETRPILKAEPEAPAAPARTGQADPTPPAAPKKRGKGKLIPLVIALGLVGAGAYEGYGYWTDGRFMVSTDDAYVSVDFAQLAPKVSGYVARIDAVENAHVLKGAPLVTLDGGDYEVALRVAEADIASQKAAMVRIERQKDAAAAMITQATARVAAANAALVQAESDFSRYNRLAANDVASGQKLDAARAAEATGKANVQEAEAGVISAQAQIAVYDAQRGEVEAALARAEATRDRAARDLDAAVIRAPYDGVVGNLSVAVGDYVTPGKRLLAVVPLGSVHVDANFKETELADMVPGTPVTIEVDAYPDRSVIGHVVSVSPASGSVFSLLPPENATGNFTKVVQRLPVRVAIPADVAGQGWLRPGMSVLATLDSRVADDLRAKGAQPVIAPDATPTATPTPGASN